MEEIIQGSSSDDLARHTREWKLFPLLPRMLLSRPPRGGVVSRERLIARFDRLCVGDWQDLIRQSLEWAEQASQATRRRRRRSNHSDQATQRAMRAQNLVLLGEMSAGRQALEGAELAPGTQATLDALCDRERRPPVLLHEPLPHDLWTRGGEVDLDKAIFTKNVRSAAGHCSVFSTRSPPVRVVSALHMCCRF